MSVVASVQSFAPALTQRGGRAPDGRTAAIWALPLAVVPAAIAVAMGIEGAVSMVLVGGLLLFGALFAVNSSLHSYLIVSYARADGVSLDVGFYYMSNAAGRLVGTILSGGVFQAHGLAACLWVSSAMLLLAVVFAVPLPRHRQVPDLAGAARARGADS